MSNSLSLADAFATRPPGGVGDSRHVVHGVLALDVGGLERIVLDLIRAGRDARQRVSVVCVERPGTLAGDAERLGATVISLDKPAGRTPETVRRAAKTLSELKPDIVHTHQLGALWYLGSAAALNGRLPVIHTEHGNHLARTSGWLQRLKGRLLIHRAARLAGRFCCVSDEIAATVTRWRTVPRRKVEVITNGIRTDVEVDDAAAGDIRRSLGIPPTSRVIGTVGRLSEVKRQDLLLHAAARLRTRFPDLHLLLVGDGPERACLEQLTDSLGLSDRVHFAGYQTQPERFLRAMDVFALTSRSEGLPVSLLEAWAARLPVVCSAVGGIPTVIESGVNGLLFPSGDVDALVERLTTLLDDPIAATALGHAGRAAVCERYSLERMAGEYSRRYRDLIAANAGAR